MIHKRRKGSARVSLAASSQVHLLEFQASCTPYIFHNGHEAPFILFLFLSPYGCFWHFFMTREVHPCCKIH